MRLNYINNNEKSLKRFLVLTSSQTWTFLDVVVLNDKDNNRISTKNILGFQYLAGAFFSWKCVIIWVKCLCFENDYNCMIGYIITNDRWRAVLCLRRMFRWVQEIWPSLILTCWHYEAESKLHSVSNITI